jgi:hypothetical protein
MFTEATSISFSIDGCQFAACCCTALVQFALGGLLQVAEMAWQQDMDLYSSNQYALVPALELHARIIMANDNETLLPQGFKLLKSMPKAPAGCVWTFDMQRQVFYAKNKTSGAWVADLNDGIKYLQGELRAQQLAITQISCRSSCMVART